MIDRDGAKVIEIIVDMDNKVWINLNGICVVRVQEVEHIMLDVRGVKMDLPTRGN